MPRLPGQGEAAVASSVCPAEEVPAPNCEGRAGRDARLAALGVERAAVIEGGSSADRPRRQR